MKYECVRKCYRGGRVYNEGDKWEGQGQPDSRDFKPSNSVTSSKKKLEAGSTLSDLQKGRGDNSVEAIRAKRALGHKNDNVSPRNDAEDPFSDVSNTNNDDDFLD